MGKRKKSERRRSSNSDTEDRTRKQSKINSNFDNSISGVISRANNILYDRKTDNPTETTETSETPLLKWPLQTMRTAVLMNL